MDNDARLDEPAAAQAVRLHLVARLVALVLPDAMRAVLARVDANDLVAAARLEIVAAPRHGASQAAADFFAQALPAVVDANVRVGREDGQRRAARAVRARGHRNGRKGVDEVEARVVVGAAALRAGAREDADVATLGVGGGGGGWVRGDALGDGGLVAAVLLPVGRVAVGGHADAVPNDGVVGNGEPGPFGRGGRGSRGNGCGRGVRGQGYEQKRTGNHDEGRFGVEVVNRETERLWFEACRWSRGAESVSKLCLS